MTTSLRKKRNKRLQREFQEFLNCPVPNCGVVPSETDISKWDVNIMVPELESAVFHFTVTYPPLYPDVAPKVRNMTYIKHGNVFGSYICLDILSMSTETKNTPFRGWTVAYTISTLLVQLQSFLFETMESVSGRARDRMICEAKEYSKAQATHEGEKIYGYYIKPAEEISERIYTPTLAEGEEIFFLAQMDNVVRSVLFEFCDEGTLAKLRFLSVGDTEAIDLAFTKKLYKCFYTLKTMDTCCIGLGAKKACMSRTSRKTRKRTLQLQQLHCSFDFICHEAFKLGVRNNVWKDRDFDWFIPLYINHSHGTHALPLAEKCILELWNTRGLEKSHRKINPELILNALAKMMNTTVVNMMKTVEDLEAGELQMFDSIKALEGFTSIHHLLLAFCDKYPDIVTTATQRVKRFIENPIMRDKEVTPDIGELLIDVAISDYSWDEFSPAWIEECFIRNARWILAKHPNLLSFERAPSCIRLTQSLRATRTGQRLAMFQRFFISEVASPDRLKGHANKNKILFSEYNKRLGRPPKGMAEKLQSHSRKVIACHNWWDWFELVNFCPPSTPDLCAWLKNSIEISEIKQYHRRNNIMRYPENWVSLPKETLQMNHLNCICANDLYKLPESCKVVHGGPKPKLVNQNKNGIDICFVLDCTGSMSSWIDSAKDSIQNIIKTVSKKCECKVRFAIAGYRDHHSQGHGDDKYVVKSYDFTRNAKRAQKLVDGYFAYGGADYPEAMCCAMKAAADMSWNRNGHQIVITIADAPPHGLGSRSDDYGDGCPCGEDSLRIAHTMRQNGIVIYPVDCGHQDATRQTFFHALARITGGYALDLKDAKLLTKIVVGACMEEALVDKLADKIAPLYEYCLKRHPEGRFEQHCQAVYSESAAKNVCVESVLPPDSYDTTEEFQVNSIAFAMDLRQARAINEQEYFVPIRRETKLCSYMERPVTLQQITKCMKRMKNVLATRKLLKEGCQYKSAKRFTKNAFKHRWKTFQSERNIKNNFTPWNPLSLTERKALKEIPDGQLIKKVCSKKARKYSDLVGKDIEIFSGGSWIKVRVKKLLPKGKIDVEHDGWNVSIQEDTKWRHIANASVAKTSSNTKEECNLATTNPISSSHETTTTPVTPKKAAAASAPIGTRMVSSQTHAPVEPRNITTPSRKHIYKVGDLVNCRMASDKPWMNGVVSHISPLSIKLNGVGTPYLFRQVRPHQILPTLVISDVLDDCTAKDLATKCQLSGFSPKNIRVGKDGQGNRMAHLVFEKHGHADCILTSGLSHFGAAMTVTWLDKYLEYRETAL